MVVYRKKKKKVKIDLITLYIYRTNTFSQFPNHFLSLTTQVVGYQGKHGKGVYEQSSLNQWKQLCIHFKFTNYVQQIKKWAESQKKITENFFHYYFQVSQW